MNKSFIAGVLFVITAIVAIYDHYVSKDFIVLTLGLVDLIIGLYYISSSRSVKSQPNKEIAKETKDEKKD